MAAAPETPPGPIVVFGATGGVGLQVVEQALSAARDVRAYVRTPSKLTLIDDRLTVVDGELTDRAAVRAAVAGASAVISALGPDLSRKATGQPLVDGTRVIVEAMTAETVPRYIGIATPSVADRRDQPSLNGRIVPLMGRLLFPRAYRELLAMTSIVTASSLDWTIARFIRPTNAAAKGSVRAGFLGRDRLGSAITRADIAAFLVAQLTDDRFHHALPAISN